MLFNTQILGYRTELFTNLKRVALLYLPSLSSSFKVTSASDVSQWRDHNLPKYCTMYLYLLFPKSSPTIIVLYCISINHCCNFRVILYSIYTPLLYPWFVLICPSIYHMPYISHISIIIPGIQIHVHIIYIYIDMECLKIGYPQIKRFTVLCPVKLPLPYSWANPILAQLEMP